MKPVPQKHLVQLGSFLVDTVTRELTKDGVRLRIPDQPVRLLIALLERPGEVVTQEELRQKLWPDDINVEFNHSIHAVVNRLRQTLEDSPEKPKFIETVPRRGYRLIAKLEMPPDSALQETPKTVTTVSESRRISTSSTVLWRRGSGLFVTAALALAVLAFYSISRFRPRTKSKITEVSSSSPMQSMPRRVAVVGFENLSRRPDSVWLSTAVAEMLSTELGTGTDLSPVSGEDVAQMKRELSIQDDGLFSRPTLKRIQANLGAETVVTGSFTRIGSGSPADRIRLDIHLQNTSTGQTVSSLSETGTVGEIFDLIAEAGVRLRQQLGATPLSSSEEAEIRHAMPANSVVQSLYFSGLDKLRSGNYMGAQEVLTRAAIADPNNALVHWALSAADTSAGHELQALQQAKAAFDLAHGLTYEQGLKVEARYYESKHDWPRAEETYRRLSNLLPGDLYCLNRLAYVQYSGGKPNDSMATLRQMRALPRSVRDDASIDLAQARAMQGVGDFKEEFAAAEAAANEGVQAGAPLVIARARLQQAVALRHLGDYLQALSHQREAATIFETFKDSGGLADTLNGEGTVLNDEGDVVNAESAYEKSQQIARTIGYKRGEAIATSNLATIFQNRGDSAKALTTYRHAYDVFREIDYKTGEATSLLGMGDSFLAEGLLSRAREYYGKSVQLSENISKGDVKADALAGLGRTLLYAGDLESAKKCLEAAEATARSSGAQAVAIGSLIDMGSVTAVQGSLREAEKLQQKAVDNANSIANKMLQAAAQRALGDTFFLQGKISEAHTNYGQALLLEHALHERNEEEETHYAMAELALEEGQSAQAQEMLRLLEIEGRPDNNLHTQLMCLILRARLALLANHAAEAQKAALRAQVVSAKQELFALKISTAEISAQSVGASGDWARADLILSSAMQLASKSHCVACVLKVQLSQCGVTAGTSARNGFLCFEKLQREAEAGGFGLIARNAASRLTALRIDRVPFISRMSTD